VRFRDDNAEDLDRARAAVRKWRAEHPQGTAGELGGQFHPDYEPVLRGVLAALELHGDRIITGGPHD
jgi:hypothetical protein